jgi:hypothetical protein
LEILGNTSDAGRRGSLFGVLDHTQVLCYAGLCHLNCISTMKVYARTS